MTNIIANTEDGRLSLGPNIKRPTLNVTYSGETRDFLEISGIIHLHSQGIFGKEVSVYISEPDGVKNTPELQLRMAKHKGGDEECMHGMVVGSIIRRIALQSDLDGGLAPTITINRARHSIEEFIMDIVPDDLNCSVCNMSWSPRPDSINARIDLSYLMMLKKCDTLFVFAAGNDQRYLIDKNETYSSWFNSLKTSEHDEKARNNSEPDFRKTYSSTLKNSLKNMIWVGSVSEKNEISAFSSRPGSEFKDHFICTLGENFLFPEFSPEPLNGTSFASPIVSGVAALIKNAYPDLSPFDIKTCILESADTKDLDPNIYGRGILNPRKALLYAEVLHKQRIDACSTKPVLDLLHRWYKTISNPEDNYEEFCLAQKWALLEQPIHSWCDYLHFNNRCDSWQDWLSFKNNRNYRQDYDIKYATRLVPADAVSVKRTYKLALGRL